MRKRPSKATAGSGKIPALAYYSLQPFGRENQNLVNLSSCRDEFILSEAQGKVQETGCGNARVNVDKHSAVLRHAGRASRISRLPMPRLLYSGRDRARKPIPPYFGENAVPPANSSSTQAQRAVFLAMHRSMASRWSAEVMPGKSSRDVRGHFHPGGKIRRHGRTNESRGMDGLGRHRTGGKKTYTAFWKRLQGSRTGCAALPCFLFKGYKSRS